MESGSHVTFINTLLPFAGILFLIALGVVFLTQQFRKNLYRKQLEQEELEKKHQVELLRSNIRAQEEERKRISRDMHDELGAALSITRMHLLQAERKYGADTADLLADLKNIRALTESSLESMRRISHELMPAQLEKFGLVKTLETVIEQLHSTEMIRIDFRTSADLSFLDHSVQLTLYRVLMELINNTLKHAEADRIRVKMNVENKALKMSYSDNGKGLSEVLDSSGLGLKGIEARISVLGGDITIGNDEYGSFNAQISVPF